MSGDLRDILNDIRSQHGRLTPAIVVQVAQDEGHPLHHRFEWDDDVAAGKWRLHQASGLLRVKFRQERGDRDPIDVRAFWPVRATAETVESDEDAADTEYRPTEEILQDPVARQVLLNSLRRDWQRFRRRYEHLQEFAEVVQADLAPDNGGDRQTA